MLHVCFATPGVLKMLRHAAGTVYGGSEQRAWRFARGLADLGFRVGIAAVEHDPQATSALGPVQMYKTAAEGGWLARMADRFKRGRVADTALWSAADADIYVGFGAAEYNADLVDWCRMKGRPVLLIAGSDADFDRDYRPGNGSRNIWGSRCDRCFDAMMGATALVVQTEHQRRLAAERYGRAAQVVANPVAIGEQAHAPEADRFLWVGKAVQNKRPDLALAVARARPEQLFVMILNDVGNGLFEQIAAVKPANVEVVQSVAPAELKAYFRRARALLCTSDFEGFPNTFLDAGVFGVPVLSLSVDPDGVLARERGGIVTNGDLGRLTEAVARYAADADEARAAGRRWHNYVRREHDLKGRVAELAAIIRGLAQPAGAVSAVS